MKRNEGRMLGIEEKIRKEMDTAKFYTNRETVQAKRVACGPYAQ